MQKIKGMVYWERGDFLYLIKHLSKEDARLRHKLRYALFRVQNELADVKNNKADNGHHKIAKKIQALKGAGDIKTFADVWDISHVTPKITIVNRLWSVHEEHNQMVKRVTVTVEKQDTPITLAKKEQTAQVREKRRLKKEINKAKAQNNQTRARKARIK